MVREMAKGSLEYALVLLLVGLVASKNWESLSLILESHEAIFIRAAKPVKEYQDITGRLMDLE